MKKLGLILVLCLVATLAYGQSEYEYAGKVANAFYVSDLAVDSAGRIYVADERMANFIVFDSDGLVLKRLSSRGMPWQIAVDSNGCVWTLSLKFTWSSYLRKYSPYPDFTLLIEQELIRGADSKGFGIGSDDSTYSLGHYCSYPELYCPEYEVILRKDADGIFIPNPNNRYNLGVVDVWGGLHHVAATGPYSIALDSTGCLYARIESGPWVSGGVAKFEVRVDEHGRTDFMHQHTLVYSWYDPSDVAIDSNDDSVFVSQEHPNTIRKYSSSGEYLFKIDTLPYFHYPTSVAVDSIGHIYVGTNSLGVHKFAVPTVEVSVCSVSGLLPHSHCENTELKEFRVGNAPTETCEECIRYVTIPVCNDSGLVPSENCQDTHEEEFVEGEQPTAVCTTCEPSILTVTIDVKPGADPNEINLGSHGVIPVAILSSATFDALTVNADTVSLGGSGVAVRGKGSKLMAHTKDVNGDGRLDLVIQVETENLDPDTFQDGYIILTGFADGREFQGFDTIVIVKE